MSLKKTFHQTTFTPIPAHIPRQLAIDLLHNHSEIIELNPLVISHQPTKAPPKALADEYYSTWYEIHQRIQLIPGTGKIGASKISFNGVFHDIPDGLQTHIYAPGGIDLRHNYSIGGNQPGEPPQVKELGSGAPSTGLYLKEDIDIRCNMVMINFVKKELRSATDVLTERLVKKAELIDAGILHAMLDEGRLKTVNPANRTSTLPVPSPGLLGNFPQSPALSGNFPRSPGLNNGFPSSPRSSTIPYSSPRLPSEGGSFTAELQGNQPNARQSQYSYAPPQGLGFELPADNTYRTQRTPSHSHTSGSQPSTDRTSYYEMSGESAVPAASHQSTSNNRASYRQMSGDSAGPAASYQSNSSSRASYHQMSGDSAGPAALSQPASSTRASYHEMSSETAPSQQNQEMDARSYGGERRSSRDAPGVEKAPEKAPEQNSSDQSSQKYYGSDRIRQLARKSSWEPEDDKSKKLGEREG